MIVGADGRPALTAHFDPDARWAPWLAHRAWRVVSVGDRRRRVTFVPELLGALWGIGLCDPPAAFVVTL